MEKLDMHLTSLKVEGYLLKLKFLPFLILTILIATKEVSLILPPEKDYYL